MSTQVSASESLTRRGFYAWAMGLPDLRPSVDGMMATMQKWFGPISAIPATKHYNEICNRCRIYCDGKQIERPFYADPITGLVASWRREEAAPVRFVDGAMRFDEDDVFIHRGKVVILVFPIGLEDEPYYFDMEQKPSDIA